MKYAWIDAQRKAYPLPAMCETLSVSITSGSTVNFVLAQGAAAAGDVSPAVSTTWNLNPGLTGAVTLFGYFNTPSAALTDGTYDIASTYVEGRMTTGAVATYTAFTQTNAVGPASGSLLLFTENVTGARRLASAYRLAVIQFP